MRKVLFLIIATIFTFGGTMRVQAQVMKAADLEKYAKSKYGDKWLDAAANLSKGLTFDKNEALTYQQVIEVPGKTKEQLYVALNYWVTATFKDKQAITLNDKEAGCIIVSSTIDAIADHTGTLFRYVVSITPLIKLDIKEGKVRVTYTVQGDKDDQKRRNQTIYSDGKRLKNDNTDRRLYDEQWEITKHYPFVEKDAQKRTCSKALVMTHAYSNAIIDKVEEALKNGITGADDDDW